MKGEIFNYENKNMLTFNRIELHKHKTKIEFYTLNHERKNTFAVSNML